ncbi:MAG: Uma2 family endonuclease [Caldilineaceae bacterium]
MFSCHQQQGFTQALVRWLSTVLSLYVQHHDLGEVLIAPFAVRLRASDQGREPDILFVRTENLARLKNTYLDGAADLIIEIAPPESMMRDRGQKYIEYEAEGVTEYWLIDPQRRSAEFHRLGDDGRYQPILPQNHVYHSAVVPGFSLDVRRLWQDPLPSELDVLRQLVSFSWGSGTGDLGIASRIRHHLIT